MPLLQEHAEFQAAQAALDAQASRFALLRMSVLQREIPEYLQAIFFWYCKREEVCSPHPEKTQRLKQFSDFRFYGLNGIHRWIDVVSGYLLKDFSA